jgi:hypothetical protein
MEIQGDTAKRPDISILIYLKRHPNCVQISFWWGQGRTIGPHPRRCLTPMYSYSQYSCVQAQYLSSIARSTGRLVSPCPSRGHLSDSIFHARVTRVNSDYTIAVVHVIPVTLLPGRTSIETEKTCEGAQDRSSLHLASLSLEGIPSDNGIT